MDIDEALRIIKGAFRSKTFLEKRHFLDMLQERQLDPEEVKQTLIKGTINGIVDQGADIYKVTIPFKKDKDLNIAVGVSEQKTIRLITIFPTETSRRLKHAKK